MLETTNPTESSVIPVPNAPNNTLDHPGKESGNPTPKPTIVNHLPKLTPLEKTPPVSVSFAVRSDEFSCAFVDRPVKPMKLMVSIQTVQYKISMNRIFKLMATTAHEKSNDCS